MPLVPLAAFAFFNKKVVDFLKELLPNDLLNRYIQILSALVGVGSAFLFAQIVQAAAHIEVFNGVTLDRLNWAGLVVYGVVGSAVGGVINDAIERRNPDADPDPPMSLRRALRGAPPRT